MSPVERPVRAVRRCSAREPWFPDMACSAIVVGDDGSHLGTVGLDSSLPGTTACGQDQVLRSADAA